MVEMTKRAGNGVLFEGKGTSKERGMEATWRWGSIRDPP